MWGTRRKGSSCMRGRLGDAIMTRGVLSTHSRAAHLMKSRNFDLARRVHLQDRRSLRMTILIDGAPNNAQVGDRLIDVIDRAGVELPHVCYHPQLGPIQTCDTCLVELNGELVRACATSVSEDMSVLTTTKRAQSARLEAFDRILTNHLLYCTVGDNNNGNCTVHNTTKMLGVEHQSIPFRTKPYEVDNKNTFYRYD